MSMKWLLLLQLLQLTCYFTSGSCGKVLVWPVEFSHWMNMKTILDELVTRGHEVTVLESSASTLIDPNKPLAMKFETFPVSLTKDDFQALAKILIETWMLVVKESLWIHLSAIQSLFDEFSDIAMKICQEAVSNKKLMEKLQESKFDVVLADAVGPCGELLAEILKVPLVYSLYFSPGYSVEKKSGKLSFPPSYVPVMMSELSDHMTFMERVKNMIYVLYFDYWFQLYDEKWDQFYSEVLGNHWMNMKTILDQLVTRSHEVTVLTPSVSTFIDPKKTSSLKLVTFPLPLIKEENENFLKLFIEKWKHAVRDSFWNHLSTVESLSWGYSDILMKTCREVVSNKELMVKLHEERFDVIFADAVGPCGELLAEILKIPFMYSLYSTPGSSVEKKSGRLPFPPSYVPVMLSELSDHMTFMERVKNMIYALYFEFWFQAYNEKKWNQFYSEVLGRPTTLVETMGKAEMWLIRNYWDFSFPRPRLPNFEFVGGIHCKPAKSLPKVLWRYDGKKPDTLGPNTQLYKWLPQNDLLGHPKTKAFVTHGGSNGIYEAIYHGVPMVGLPLFADQPHNIVHMKAKGAAVRLDLETMSTEDLLSALKEVINNPSYKQNVMRLSAIHHDRPVKPLDLAVFWIEFVMRHKGAKHLRPAIHNLTWLQYHSLDVIGFLLACVATAAFVVTKCCLFCYQKFAGKGKKGKRD
ncbi:UDP-glucuronosyltransferase 2B4-like isoform X2 [Capricornis sumatraensis]|uniref:UDP-glucuronosyltransferase 2B4-like isoform X2 n=1 Tax=Capricornis sumatraensis TaxID=34865 RepID=UPI00360494AB